MLNLLNHPLQLQLVTGDLPLGSFQRLLSDRLVLLEGLETSAAGLFLLEDDDIDIHSIIQAHHEDAHQWLTMAQAQGKTIRTPGIACYTCGGEHLNIDCPDDQEPSQSVRALHSVLQTSGLAGAMAILEGYSFVCSRLLEALRKSDTNHGCDTVYHGWLEAHAEQWSRLADLCHEKMGKSSIVEDDSAAYTTCLSMLYNWIDTEAATTGIRADLNDPMMASLMETLEEMEPGYAAQRDKHSSFAADIAGVATTRAKENGATAKANAAAAYLAAKKKKQEGQQE